MYIYNEKQNKNTTLSAGTAPIGKSYKLTHKTHIYITACFLYLVLGTATSIKRWRDKTRSLGPNHPS